MDVLRVRVRGVLNTINPMGVDEFTIIVRRESFPEHAQVEEIPRRETFLYYFIIWNGMVAKFWDFGFICT